MFKRSLLIAAFAASLSPALASDFATKAVPYALPPVSCTPQNCSGWYGSFGILGDGSNADIIGGGLNNSLFQTGGAITVGGGYQFWSGSLFAAVEGNVGYEFTRNSASPLTQGGSKFIGQELVKLGYNFFPNASSAPVVASQSAVPGLVAPANLLAASTPYLVFGGMQRRGHSMWVNGAGVETIVASSWTTSLEYLYAPSQNAEPATNIISLKLQKHF